MKTEEEVLKNIAESIKQLNEAVIEAYDLGLHVDLIKWVEHSMGRAPIDTVRATVHKTLLRT